MKFKLMPMLAGAISLTVIATPFIAKADNPGSEPSPAVTQPTQHHSPFANLNLTQQQQDQLAQIKSDIEARTNQVLTSDQQDQLQAAISAGKGRRAAFKSLNLSEEQKNQIKQIWQSSRQQMEAVLTPEQRQQLQANFRRHSPFASLNLTQQQKEQLAQTRSSTRNQINQVLTSDQQNQLQAAIQAGQKRREAFKSLNRLPT